MWDGYKKDGRTWQTIVWSSRQSASKVNTMWCMFRRTELHALHVCLCSHIYDEVITRVVAAVTGIVVALRRTCAVLWPWKNGRMCDGALPFSLFLFVYDDGEVLVWLDSYALRSSYSRRANKCDELDQHESSSYSTWKGIWAPALLHQISPLMLGWCIVINENVGVDRW